MAASLLIKLRDMFWFSDLDKCSVVKSYEPPCPTVKQRSSPTTPDYGSCKPHSFDCVTTILPLTIAASMPRCSIGHPATAQPPNSKNLGVRYD